MTTGGLRQTTVQTSGREENLPVSRFDVLVVTALLDELTALHAVDGGAGKWAEARHPAGFVYHYRQIDTLWIAAVWAGEMGETATAVRATSLIDHLNPACLAMCGICAGNRSDVFLGDTIVADRIYSYDHGKLIATKRSHSRREEQFLHDITTYNLDVLWRDDAAYFAQDPDFVKRMTRARPPSHERQEAWILGRLFDHAAGRCSAPIDDPERQTACPDWTNRIKALTRTKLICRSGSSLSLTPKGGGLVEKERVDYPDGHPGDPAFRIHVGPIATGKTVREDPEIFDRLRRFARKTIGIEMEAAAIGSVAHQFHRRAIVVKAVSDYGDHDKDDGYRAFAARAAAEVLMKLLRRQLARGAAQSVPAKNPFKTAGSLPAGHATYVTRACDTALTDALKTKSLIALEGDFSNGKSSLALRARAQLDATHTTCYIDLQNHRCDDERIFLRGFFEQLSAALHRKVDDWSLLHDGLGPPLAVIIDEFGHLSDSTAQSFVQKLVPFAEGHRDHVRVIVCLPLPTVNESIGSFLKGLGVDNPKYRRAWHPIRVPFFNKAEVERLLAFLPPRASRVAGEHADLILTRSGGHPLAVQRMCSRLFDAEVAGASSEDLKAILNAKESYE
jgi:nucleoside phosphorylase